MGELTAGSNPWVYLAGLVIVGVGTWFGKNGYQALLKHRSEDHQTVRKQARDLTDWWITRYEGELHKLGKRLDTLEDEVAELRLQNAAKDRQLSDLSDQLRIALDYITELTVQWVQRLPDVAPPAPPRKLRGLLDGEPDERWG